MADGPDMSMFGGSAVAAKGSPGPAPQRTPAPEPAPAAPPQAQPGGPDMSMFAPPKHLSLGDVAGQYASDIGHQYEEGVRAMGEGLDSSTPFKAALHSIPGLQAGELAAGALQSGFSFLTGPLTTGVGRPLETLTGGRIKAEDTGNLLSMAIPFVGEANEARAVSQFAKEAKISEAAAKAWIEKARIVTKHGALSPEDQAKKKAAKRLVTEGGLNTRQAGERVGALLAQTKESGVERPPTLLDTMDKRGQRVVRASSRVLGEGTETLSAHREAVREGLAEETASRTQKELPRPNATVKQRRAALRAEQKALAREKYREPYQTPVDLSAEVPVDPEDDESQTKPVYDILRSPAGMGSIAEARKTAVEREFGDSEAGQHVTELDALRDHIADKAEYDKRLADHEARTRQYEAQMKVWEAKKDTPTKPVPKPEMDRLNDPNLAEDEKDDIRAKYFPKKPAKPPEFTDKEPTAPTVSAGALDRVRQAMGEKVGELAGKKGKRGRAEGVMTRRNALDAYLDQVPELSEARAEFRDYSVRMKQLDTEEKLTENPIDFAEHADSLTPEQKEEFAQKLIGDLQTKIASASSGSQRQADVMVTSPWMKENLRKLLGDERADKYMQAVKIMRDRLRKATFVDTNIGSQTGGIQEDTERTAQESLFQFFAGNRHAAINTIARWVYRYSRYMDEATANQLAEWAVQQKDVHETLQEMEEALNKKAGTTQVTNRLPPHIRALLAGAGAAGAAGAGSGAMRGPQPALQSPDETPALAGPQ